MPSLRSSLWGGHPGHADCVEELGRDGPAAGAALVGDFVGREHGLDVSAGESLRDAVVESVDGLIEGREDGTLAEVRGVVGPRGQLAVDSVDHPGLAGLREAHVVGDLDVVLGEGGRDGTVPDSE